VAKVVPAVRPWIGLASCRGATSALELAAGEAARRGLAVGDRLAVTGGA
jgi:hypothetical protein